MQDHIDGVFESVVGGHRERVETAVRRSLESGIPAETVLKEGLVRAMDEVGRRFETCEYYVPEMLAAARAMKAGLSLLKADLVTTSPAAGPRVVLGTVQGDMHDIGKSLVGMMLEGAGFEVHDLGVDVSPAHFVEVVREVRPSVVGLSALLTTTMTQMRATITAIEQSGLRPEVRIIVGGAPVTEAFARAIGADGTAPDASRAVALVRGLLSA
jgi:5-methyltetrahydrofolate--homocysteine methyltransferase